MTSTGVTFARNNLKESNKFDILNAAYGYNRVLDPRNKVPTPIQHSFFFRNPEEFCLAKHHQYVLANQQNAADTIALFCC